MSRTHMYAFISLLLNALLTLWVWSYGVDGFVLVPIAIFSGPLFIISIIGFCEFMWWLEHL